VDDERRVRVEIGFDGGQIIGALVEPESADALERALDAHEEGSVVLDAQEGSFRVQLRSVVYVKRFRSGGRVGFGSA
jgi:hypothetical protein